MFGLGFQEVLLLLLIALLIFGARRLPEVGRSLGKAVSEFKKAFQGEGKDEADKTDDADKKQQP